MPRYMAETIPAGTARQTIRVVMDMLESEKDIMWPAGVDESSLARHRIARAALDLFRARLENAVVLKRRPGIPPLTHRLP